LCPATRKIASRAGSKANSFRISLDRGRGRPQLLHVVVAAALHTIDQGTPERGALLGELIYRISDEITGVRIAYADLEIPRLHLRMQADLPGHELIITLLSYRPTLS